MQGWIDQALPYPRRGALWHFYLIDNGSKDEWKAVVNPYVVEGIVTVFEKKKGAHNSTSNNKNKKSEEGFERQTLIRKCFNCCKDFVLKIQRK